MVGFCFVPLFYFLRCLYLLYVYIIGLGQEQEPEPEPEPEPEQEQALNDTPDVSESVDVEALIAKIGDSPVLALSLEGLTGPDMKIIADTLRNNTVK
jgi:hypothetical protein